MGGTRRRGGGGAILAAALAAWSCDGQRGMQVGSLEVVLETQAPFARSPDFPARLETTVQAALDYWGGGWSALDGVTLVLTDARAIRCGEGEALGCFERRSLKVTTQDPSLGTFPCVESTVLVHEIGHAVIGDPTHQDPRWMEMDALSEVLSGRPGHDGTPDGQAACPIYLSVWRHPLGSR